jgi:hypothetical protein
MADYRELLDFLTVFLLGGLLFYFFIPRRFRAASSVFRILADKEEIDLITEALSKENFPWILEVLVPHLGRRTEFFISSPVNPDWSLRLKKIAPAIRMAEEEKSPSLFHPAGEHLVFELISDQPVRIARFNFSEINELGESCLIQIVHRAKKRNEARLLVSAPSSFQAEEIAGKIIPAGEGIKMRKPRSRDELIEKINFRKF